MYDLAEEQEIARAVASKVNAGFVDVGMAKGESFFEAQKAYHTILKQRAVRFLKDLDQKIETLSNQEVADLLRVLLAGGLIIESEEELEYWIAILEQIALQRVAKVMEQMADGNMQVPVDAKGIISLIEVLKIAHLKREPKDKNSPEFAKWQELMKHFNKAEKFVKQGARGQNQQKGSRRSKQSGSKQENSSDDNSRDELIGKMVAAGVPPYGPYWNDVLSGYESASDKADFTARWVVDEARRDAENDNKKEQNQNERPEKEKTEPEKKPEKSDQEKIDELRMGKQQKNQEKIDEEFQNPGNAKIAKEAGDKKLEKTGQELTDKDIAAIKTKIIGGR